MSENAIDESISKPAPDTAKPKRDRANKKAKVDRDDEAGQGRNPGRDHESNALAAAHRAGLRQHTRQQGRREDRVVQKRRGRTDVQDREIASGNSSSKRRLGHLPGAAFLLLGPPIRQQVTSRTRHVTKKRGFAPKSIRAELFRFETARNAVSWRQTRPQWRSGRYAGLFLQPESASAPVREDWEPFPTDPARYGYRAPRRRQSWAISGVFCAERYRKGTRSERVAPQTFDSLPFSAAQKRAVFGKTRS